MHLTFSADLQKKEMSVEKHKTDMKHERDLEVSSLEAQKFPGFIFEKSLISEDFVKILMNCLGIWKIWPLTNHPNQIKSKNQFIELS